MLDVVTHPDMRWGEENPNIEKIVMIQRLSYLVECCRGWVHEFSENGWIVVWKLENHHRLSLVVFQRETLSAFHINFHQDLLSIVLISNNKGDGIEVAIGVPSLNHIVSKHQMIYLLLIS